MTAIPHVQEFFLSDYPRTLFPLKLNKLLVENAVHELAQYICQSILNDEERLHGFLPQQRVHATKPNWHLRRTVKLDPVSEYFIYDLVYRNRRIFRKSQSQRRLAYGYRFEEGEPIPVNSALAAFSETREHFCSHYSNAITLDIACYFNHIYHHDLVRWFADAGASQEDTNAFGRFLREINAGRSVDCLPQGIYPCKMIGSAFLSFIDNTNRISSAQLLRFMDDICLFDDREDQLIADFIQIQRLLGEKGLSVNPSKTRILSTGDLLSTLQGKVDQERLEVLGRGAAEVDIFGNPYINDGIEVEHEGSLTLVQKEYLLNLLENDAVEEDDVGLILSYMRDCPEDLLEYLGLLLQGYPNLAKRIHYFFRQVQDKDAVTDEIIDFLGRIQHVGEFQLFWFGMMLDDYLYDTKKASDLMIKLFEADGATPISKAKILEIPENRFGMPELREEYLKAGRSDWLSWAAAMGTRRQKKAHRNHLLKYFRKASHMNRIITECVSSLD